jgi:hypothetical protein
MCAWGTYRLIYTVRHVSPEVPDGWHPVYVDACIAPYVQTLNRLGILTLQCCCGHGRSTWASVMIAAASIPLLELCGLAYKPVEDRDDVVEHLFPYVPSSRYELNLQSDTFLYVAYRDAIALHQQAKEDGYSTS